MSKDGSVTEANANVLISQIQPKKKSRSFINNQTLQQDDDSQCQQLNLLDEPKVIFF